MKVSTLFTVVTALVAGASALPAAEAQDAAVPAPLTARAAKCKSGYTNYYCLYYRPNNGGSGGSCNLAGKIKKDPILYDLCCNGRRIGGGGSWDFVGGCYKA